MAATNTSAGYWESIPMTVQSFCDREVWSIGYEGDTESILNFSARYVVGDRYSTAGGGNMIIIDNRVTRKPGGLSDCILSFASIYPLEIWNIDFAEVSKDVRTWLVKKFKDDGRENQAYVELAKIKKWEHYKDIERGSKTFELRKNDRDFQVGDILMLIKLDGEGNETDQVIKKKVVYILKDCPQYGLKDGYAILGIDAADRIDGTGVLPNGWVGHIK